MKNKCVMSNKLKVHVCVVMNETSFTCWAAF